MDNQNGISFQFSDQTALWTKLKSGDSVWLRHGETLCRKGGNVFFTIVYEITVAVLLIFGAIYTVPRLMSYHKKIVEKEGEAKGFNTLKNAFSTLMNLSIVFLIAVSLGMLFSEATIIVSNSTDATELISSPSKMLSLSLVGVCCLFPLSCGKHLLREIETMDIKQQALRYKTLAGIVLIALAISFHNCYYFSQHARDGRTLPAEMTLFTFLILLTSQTHYLGYEKGVRTPWWIPLGFACLVLAGVIVKLIQT